MHVHRQGTATDLAKALLVLATQMRAIRNYLLEKPRVVNPAKDERSFHVSYQLLSGASTEERSALHLAPASTFHFLSRSGCLTVSGTNDKDEYYAMRAAMVRPKAQAQAPKKVKNVTRSKLLGKRGRLHMPKQDLTKMATARMKAYRAPSAAGKR